MAAVDPRPGRCRCLISRSLATHTTTEPFVTLSRCPPSVCPLWPSKKRKKLKKKQSNTLGEKEDLLLLLLLLLRLGLLPLLLPLFPRTSMLPLVVGFFIGFPKKKEKKRKEKESSDPGMTRNDSTRGRTTKRMKKKEKKTTKTTRRVRRSSMEKEHAEMGFINSFRSVLMDQPISMLIDSVP